MEATLTELRRDTSRVLEPVRKGEKVTVTEHGQKLAEIIPVKIDRKAAFEALRAIGPVELPPRK
jgi:prevent-host-death family protein